MLPLKVMLPNNMNPNNMKSNSKKQSCMLYALALNVADFECGRYIQLFAAGAEWQDIKLKRPRPKPLKTAEPQRQPQTAEPQPQPEASSSMSADELENYCTCPITQASHIP